MKRYRILALALAAALSWACVEIEYFDGDLTGITLQFDCGDFPETKAKTDMPGEDPYHENTLSSVEYFLYPDNGTESDAVMHGYLVDVVASTKVYSVPMTDDLLNTVLCPGTSRYFQVYAIANHPRIIPQAATEDLSHTSVAELEEKTRELDTDSNTGEILTPQNNFFMSTNGAFRVGPVDKHATNVVNARVPLERIPAKITILVRLEESVTIPNTVVINGVEDTRNEVWRPRPGEMQVYLVNGALEGRASGRPVDTPALFTYPTFEFKSGITETHNYSTFTPVLDGEGNVTDYTETTHSGEFVACDAPFYTNPISWEYGSSEEPYIKLMVPWDRDAGVSTGGVSYGTASKNYYYRVYCPGDPIDGSHAQFVRNNWYKIVLNVGVLGSDTDGGESIIHGQYYVVDWQERESGGGSSGSGIHDSDKEAEIKGARYLFINKEEYELFNVNDLSIPYTTSDPCEIVNNTGGTTITATYYTFTGSSKQQQTVDATSWVSLSSVGGAHIIFNHTLNNDTNTTDYDTSEYTITFTLRQKDNHNYKKEITIHQYPAIMIDMEDNSNTSNNGYVYLNNNYYRTNNYNGSTYVTLPSGYTNSSYGIGSNGTSSGTNKNFNMFIVETTVLPSDSEYVLGDPRVSTIDNLNPTNWPTSRTTDEANWSSNTASIQGTTRRLSYYYPVDDSKAADDIIAPKFRVASSHGATLPVSYANAFRRCASYQEKGYPAGRWRLPTAAEVSYITKLSADGMIDRLFGSTTNGETSNYWCNSGYITVYDGTDAASKTKPVLHRGEIGGNDKSVRCVYDEWYWDGMELNNTAVSTVTPLTTFKWGDMAR